MNVVDSVIQSHTTNRTVAAPPKEIIGRIENIDIQLPEPPTEPPSRKKQPWSPEARAAAAERMKSMWASGRLKKSGIDESEDDHEESPVDDNEAEAAANPVVEQPKATVYPKKPLGRKKPYWSPEARAAAAERTRKEARQGRGEKPKWRREAQLGLLWCQAPADHLARRNVHVHRPRRPDGHQAPARLRNRGCARSQGAPEEQLLSGEREHAPSAALPRSRSRHPVPSGLRRRGRTTAQRQTEER